MASTEFMGRLKADMLLRRGPWALQAIGVSQRIHDLAEISGQEFRSRDVLLQSLAQVDCAPSSGLGQFDTGVRATLGCRPPRIGLMAEYDALPNVGHACGHNLIAGAAYLAFCLLSTVIDRLDATVLFLGTPAEERGMAKAVLTEAGEFDGLDAALMCHPAAVDSDAPRLCALRRWGLEVNSQSYGHGASAGRGGVPVGEALGLLQVALQFARRRLAPGQFLDLEILSTSSAANVRAESATADVIARAERAADLDDVETVLRECCDGVGHITGTVFALVQNQPTGHEMKQDPELARLWAINRSFLGAHSWSMDVPVATDLGNLSHRIPCLHPYFGIGSWPALNHDPGFAIAAATPGAHRAMIRAGTVLAMTVADVALQRDTAVTPVEEVGALP
jgi:amidohydrolase